MRNGSVFGVTFSFFLSFRCVEVLPLRRQTVVRSERNYEKNEQNHIFNILYKLNVKLCEKTRQIGG